MKFESKYVFENRTGICGEVDFGELIKKIPETELPAVDKGKVAEYLLGLFPAGETVFTDMSFEWSKNNSENEDFTRREFSQLAEENVKKMAAELKGRLGITVSGGVDSAVVLAAALNLGLRPVVLTLALPGEMGGRQKERLAGTITEKKLDWLMTEAGDYGWDVNKSRYGDIYLDIYWQATQELARKAKAAGVRTVWTGFGGDELARAGKFGAETETAEIELPDYFTGKFAAVFSGLPRRKNLAVGVPESIIFSLRHYGVIWNKFGIDVDNLFSDAVWWKWVTGVDKTGWKGKEIMRRYLRENGFGEIADCTGKDSFREVYLRGAAGYVRSGLDELMKEPILAGWGWLDKQKIMESERRNLSDYEQELKYLYRVVKMETFLQGYPVRNGGGLIG